MGVPWGVPHGGGSSNSGLQIPGIRIEILQVEVYERVGKSVIYLF